MAAAALVGGVPLPDMVRECVQLACLASEKILGPFNPNFNLSNSIRVRFLFKDLFAYKLGLNH